MVLQYTKIYAVQEVTVRYLIQQCPNKKAFYSTPQLLQEQAMPMTTSNSNCTSCAMPYELTLTTYFIKGGQNPVLARMVNVCVTAVLKILLFAHKLWVVRQYCATFKGDGPIISPFVDFLFRFHINNGNDDEWNLIRNYGLGNAL